MLRHAELGLRSALSRGRIGDFGLGGDVGFRPITTSSRVLGILENYSVCGRGFFGIFGKAAARQGRVCVFRREDAPSLFLRNEDEAAPLWEAERYRSRANPWEHIGGEWYELDD